MLLVSRRYRELVRFPLADMARFRYICGSKPLPPEGRIRGMPRKKRLKYDFPPEIRTVLCNSPNLQLCPKFRRASADKVIGHIRKDRCEQCLAVFCQLMDESDMICFLTRNKN